MVSIQIVPAQCVIATGLRTNTINSRQSRLQRRNDVDFFEALMRTIAMRLLWVSANETDLYSALCAIYGCCKVS